MDLESITAAVDAAVEGSGSVLLIEGEAGVGKTELLRAARRIAADAGLKPLAARASELERDYAFGIVRQLFQARLAELDAGARAEALSGAAALAGGLLDVPDRERSPAGGESGFALLHGLYWLCANLALKQPLALAVDDAHWADLPSLRFLHFLAGRIEELPVLAIATVRTGEPDAPEAVLREIRSEQASRRLRPTPLSLDATVSYLRERISSAAELAFCGACHHATGGNPLLLAELCQALTLEGIKPTEAESVRVAEIGGRGLAERLLARIDRLGAEASAIARAVAILEPHATLRRVSATADLPADAAASSAHALVEAGVLADENPLRFTHPLLRSAVEGALTEPQRQHLHGAAALAHHAEAGEPGVIAAHLVQAETVAGEWVVHSLRAAAEQALARGAPEPATSFVRRALQEPVADPERIRLMRLLGSALIRAGDEDGIEWLKRARDASDEPDFRAWVVEEVGPSLMIRGRIEEYVALTEASIAELDGRTTETELALLAALVRAGIGGYEDAFAAPYERLREAARGTDGGSLERRLAHQSLAFGGAFGLMSAAEARHHALLAIGDEDGAYEAAALGRPLGMAAEALAICGETGRALKASEIGVQGMRRRASLFGLTSQLTTQATIHLSRGEIVAAAMDADEADRLAGGVPNVPQVVAGVRAVIALERGDAAAAGGILTDRGLMDDLPKGGPIGFIWLARARLRLGQGRAEAALADLSGAAAMFHGVGLVGPDLLPARLHRALALFALGRNDEASEMAEEEERWAREIENPRLVGEALRVRGAVDAKAGIDALREAAETFGGTDFRLDHARALVDFGSALRRAKERKASREPLREGMEIAHGCGATALEERARVELAATGARPRSVLLTGAESLTPSERRVAELAATGMTNREIAQSLFVTPKTVETHLRHCYQKLDIAGRGDLSSALAR
jgi:DNA-binding CsgD family transcriptional regulator/tetratricopeptide (TPR) repeat protein